MSLFGKNAVLYYSEELLSAESEASDKDWEEQDNVVDLTDNFSPTEADVTTRATAKLGWEATAVVLKAGEITFNAIVKAGDEFVAALFDAFLNGTEICLMDLSASEDPPGAFGLAANFSVAITHAKPVKGVQTIDVTLKISSFPEWVTVEGS